MELLGTKGLSLVACPICGGLDCKHFIGWFEGGKLVDRNPLGRSPLVRADDGGPLPTDVVAGPTNRVYRDWVLG